MGLGEKKWEIGKIMTGNLKGTTVKYIQPEQESKKMEKRELRRYVV
jgi:hypothetical protein